MFVFVRMFNMVKIKGSAEYFNSAQGKMQIDSLLIHNVTIKWQTLLHEARFYIHVFSECINRIMIGKTFSMLSLFFNSILLMRFIGFNLKKNSRLICLDIS